MTPATACSVRAAERPAARLPSTRLDAARDASVHEPVLRSVATSSQQRKRQQHAPNVRQPQARFADDDVALDIDVVARETAGALKGMVGGGEAKGLSAPTTEAIKREARGGTCEAWPRAFVHDGNPLGERAPPRRRQIIIETKMESVC